MVRRGRRIESARGTRTPSPPPPTTATEITWAQLKARCETAFGGELRITLAVRSREGRGRPHRRKLTAPDVAAHGHRYRAAAFVGQGTATHARRRLAVWDRARSYDHSSLVLPSRCSTAPTDRPSADTPTEARTRMRETDAAWKTWFRSPRRAAPSPRAGGCG